MQPEIYTMIHNVHVHVLFLPNILIIVRQAGLYLCETWKKLCYPLSFSLFSHFEKETRIWDEFFTVPVYFPRTFFPSPHSLKSYMGVLFKSKRKQSIRFLYGKERVDKVIVQPRCHFYLLRGELKAI